MGLAGWSRAGWDGGGRGGRARGVQGVFSWLIFQRHTYLLVCFWVCLDTTSLDMPPCLAPGSILLRWLTWTRRRKRERERVGLYFQLDRAHHVGWGRFLSIPGSVISQHSSKVSWMRGKDGWKRGIGMGWAIQVDVWLVGGTTRRSRTMVLRMERLDVLRWPVFILRIDCVSVSSGAIFLLKP